MIIEYLYNIYFYNLQGDGTKLTAIERRLQLNYTLIIGLNCTSENVSTCFSNGLLYFQNSSYMNINADELKFNITILDWELAKLGICGSEKVSSTIIDRIKVYGKENTSGSVPKYYYEENLGIDICEICKSNTDVCTYTVEYKN